MIRVIRPGVGRKFFSGSSALMRHSIAQPALHDVLLGEGQGLARGHQDLRLDQVDARDHLRHRVLDLDAGVHLDEVIVALLVDDELDGARIVVIGQFHQPHGRFAHGLPGFDGQAGSGTLLDQLLVAALHGAVALPEVEGVAVQVGDDLDLDVAGLLDVFLQVDLGTAESGFGLGLGLLQGRFQGQFVQGHAHAPPAPARRGLDQHGKTEPLGQRQGLGLALDQPFAPRHRGHLRLAGHLAGRVLVAQQGHGLRGRTDERDVAVAADFGKMGVLGQKAVARMDGLHVAHFGGADDAVDFQVAFAGLGGTDAVSLVGHLQVGGAAVRLAEDGHALHAQLAAGAKDPQGDLAPIGNQNALEHQPRVSTLNRG